MSKKGSITTTSGMDWNTMIGLTNRLKKDGKLREYLLITTGCYFGLRAGDLLNLKWNDVIDKDEFYVIEQKTKKRRKITINGSVKEALSFVKNFLIKEGTYANNNYMFPNRKGQKITIQFINKILHKTLDRYSVSVQNPSTHTLRKSFGRRVWEMDGKSERALVYLSEIFSHSSINTTKKYIGITEQNIADVYLKL